MAIDPRGQNGVETVLNWGDTLRMMKGVVRRHLTSAERHDVEDVAQEAAIRLLRASRSSAAILEVDRLAYDIARKTIKDYVRRKTRWRRIMTGMADPTTLDRVGSPPSAGGIGDPIERFRFVVLEYFRGSAPGCEDLARVHFEGKESWKDVALRTGATPESVRQRWSRCVASLRDRIRRDRDFLGGIEMEI